MVKCDKCGMERRFGFDWDHFREDNILICPECTINQPERSKREDHESGCGALNTIEI